MTSLHPVSRGDNRGSAAGLHMGMTPKAAAAARVDSWAMSASPTRSGAVRSFRTSSRGGQSSRVMMPWRFRPTPASRMLLIAERPTTRRRHHPEADPRLIASCRRSTTCRCSSSPTDLGVWARSPSTWCDAETAGAGAEPGARHLENRSMPYPGAVACARASTGADAASVIDDFMKSGASPTRRAPARGEESDA